MALPPSEYIFKTRCESLLATGAVMPGNISFMTYAKLSMLEPAELDALHPDVVILDEMHRAAAPTWEQPVQTLLSQNPIAIGLTATHIRYLDNQKDTTETFDMTVASEMTLGEAVVLGILNPPCYVLSVYSYQQSMEKYRRRIRNAKNGTVRQAAADQSGHLKILYCIDMLNEGIHVDNVSGVILLRPTISPSFTSSRSGAH